MKKVMKAVTALMLMTAVVFAVGCTKSDESNNGGDNNGGNNGGGNQSHHEYVDLGLPSGTLWATCNVGANAPEECGDYFAWGETSPKTTYNWSTYKWCNGGNKNKLTKYCTESDYGDNGFVDNLTRLQPEDDAATANWGSDWRMPTRAEWEELSDNTNKLWTIQNGVYGSQYTATNGKSIFLPAAGYYCENEVFKNQGANSRGYYGTNSLNSGEVNLSWTFFSEFHYDGFYCYYFERNLGRSVRPVRSAK